MFANLAAILDAAGALGGRREDDGLPARHERLPAVNEVYARVSATARPARSTVQVSALPRGVLVEIDAIAAGPLTIDLKLDRSEPRTHDANTRATSCSGSTAFARCAG